MTDQQEKILFEVHAKLTDGIEARLERIDRWMSQRPVECPLTVKRRMADQKRARLKIVAAIIGIILGLPMFVAGMITTIEELSK